MGCPKREGCYEGLRSHIAPPSMSRWDAVCHLFVFCINVELSICLFFFNQIGYKECPFENALKAENDRFRISLGLKRMPKARKRNAWLVDEEA